MMRSSESLNVTWQQPTFLLPLFNLCVLLASTESLAMAISVALLMLVVSVFSSVLLPLLTRLTGQPPNMMVWLIFAGTFTAIQEMLLHAWFYTFFKQMGLFLPMIMVSTLLLVRQEMQQHLKSLRLAISRSLLMSAGYALAAVVLGASRELVGHGSLFMQASDLWGNWAKALELQIFQPDMGFLLAKLAPGAFIALGLGVALYNWLELKLHKRGKTVSP